MSHTIADKTKLSTTVIFGTHATISANIQAHWLSLTNGDKIVDISITRKSVGNQYFAVITVEGQ